MSPSWAGATASTCPIRAPVPHAQFGSGYAELRHFRPRFAEALAAAVAAYPEAKVGVADDGITLHPSCPPVPPLAVARA